MKKKLFKTAFVIILFIGICTAAWTQEEKNNIFSITPAFSFAWYPYANISDEESTKTNVDINNFGMSAIMSLKLFDKVGAYFNLKIDDPTFQKLVDFAGYVTAYYFMLKFDYHYFGGNVTWAGSTPNPIPGGVYNFRNQWSNVSLLFRVDQLKINTNNSFGNSLHGLLSELRLIGTGNLGAIGIGYARYDMPLEYQVKNDTKLSYPGFGLLIGEAWGITLLWDTLSWNMERPDSSPEGIMKFMQYVWIYLDYFHCFPPFFKGIVKGELDTQAIAWMSNENGVSVDGNITPFLMTIKANLGLQYVWDVGKKGRIGLAAGVEYLSESIWASNNDINISFLLRNIGPAVRVSAYW